MNNFWNPIVVIPAIIALVLVWLVLKDSKIKIVLKIVIGVFAFLLLYWLLHYIFIAVLLFLTFVF